MWQGIKACKANVERAQQAVENLKTSVSDLHNKSLDVTEILEGEETDAFWDTLGDEEDYMSYIEGKFLFHDLFQKTFFLLALLPYFLSACIFLFFYTSCSYITVMDC